jgi:hypothetical protein
VNDRVEDYRRLLEQRQKDAQMERSQQAPGTAAPAASPAPPPSPRAVPQQVPNRRSDALVQESGRIVVT